MANNRQALYWSLQIAGWGAYFSFCATAMLLRTGRVNVLAPWFIVFVFHLAVSHALRAFIRQGHWLDRRTRPPVLRILAGCIGAAIAANLLVAPFPALLRMNSLAEQIAMLRFFIPSSFALFLLWCVCYLGFQYFFRYRDSEYHRLRLQASVREAELRALKAQVNPHFLFNCLNNLRALIAEDPDKARAMLLHLSDLLRYSLEAGMRDMVPLAEELAIVEEYLSLEKLQFENRLTWRFDISDAAKQTMLPTMLLQQLVENAIKHGISQNTGGGEIAIVGRRGPGGLELRVENTGQLKATRHPGFGIENVRERLRLLCGANASFELCNVGNTLVAATARIPLAA